MVVITLTALAVGALALANFVGLMGDEIKETADEMVSDETISSANANYSTDFIKNDVEGYTDNFVFWVFIAVFAGLILTAMYLEFEPSIMIIIFIFGTIAVLGAWIGSQVYTDFGTDTDLSSTSDSMSKTKILMGNPYFPVFIFVGLIVMMVIMYSKKRSGEYQ
jgi:E3 ubiquitin-protein ligase DOA10